MTEQRDRPKKRKHWGRRILLLLLLLLVGSGAAGYYVEVNQYVYGQGYVMGQADVKIFPLQKGPVVEVFAGDGEMVEEGQVLAQLEDADHRIARTHAEREVAELQARVRALEAEKQINELLRVSTVSEAEAVLQAAREDLKRVKDLRDAKQASHREFARAELDVRIAKIKLERAGHSEAASYDRRKDVLLRQIDTTRAAIEAATIHQEMRKIRAPMSGMLMSLKLGVGEVVDTGQVIGQIFDVSGWIVEATVPEWASAEVRVGQPVRVELSAFPALTYDYQNGKIKGIRRIVEPKSTGDGYLTLQTALKDSPLDRKFKPGMSASIRITTGRTRLLWRLLTLR